MQATHTLSERMHQAVMGTGPVHRKRGRSPSLSSSSSSSKSRATKRPRYSSPSLRAREEGEGEGTDNEDTLAIRTIAHEDDEPQVYTSLDVAGETIMEEYMDHQQFGRQRHRDCFICNFQERYEHESIRGRSGQLFKRHDFYAYLLLQEYYQRHPTLDLMRKAEEMCRLYRIHIYEPWTEAQQTRGNNKNNYYLNLPEPKERTFLEHLNFYTYDPVAGHMECVRNQQLFVLATKAKAIVSGGLDPVMLRLAQDANMKLSTLWQIQDKMGGGVRHNGFALDPQKVMQFGSAYVLEQMQARNHGNALGGATATNNQEALQEMNAQRPVMGEVESVEMSSSSDSSDSEEDTNLDQLLHHLD